MPITVQSEDLKQPVQAKEPDENGNFYKPTMPTLRLYKICKGKDYKRSDEIEENQNNRIDEGNKEEEIIKIELVEQYEFPTLMSDDPMYHHWKLFDQVTDETDDKHVLHVDNNGHVIYIHPYEKIFLLNGINIWNQFQAILDKAKLGTWDDFSIFKFGQGYIMLKQKEILFHFKYDGEKLKLFHGKSIKHKALDTKECDLELIVPSKLSKYVLLFYKLGESYTIVVWDLEIDFEHSNFSSREKDEFMEYITGKNSQIGILCFDKYIVDLDNGIPNPFMSKKYKGRELYWCQGMKINCAEDMVLSLGTIITPLCHKDIYFYKNKSLDNLDQQKIVYYLNKHSIAFDYLDDSEKLATILKLFESEPLYYSMLILENNEGKTPLDEAIEDNSAKIIEVILNSLLNFTDFSLSKKIYKKFATLFHMNLTSFEKYLNTCYFTTQQMKSITKAKIKGEDTIRESYTCCILDKEFYKKYQIAGAGIEEDKITEKIKSNAVVPLDRSLSTNISPEQFAHPNEGEDAAIFEEEIATLKRVQIKGIEFDWIFNSEEGNTFLHNLSETSNIEIFGQDIIKDIILFQWSYFKEMIILKLLIPYIVYFAFFCIYATWIVYERNNESDTNGPYHMIGYAGGGVILAFNLFWAYVEITQMIFHKMGYIKSFWNMLDLSSVLLNSAVIALIYIDAKYETINRVSSISVLILYFKLFYFLRIFFNTAYLVRMIIEIVLDMKFFVSVLMIATIAFANSFYILGRNSEGPNLAGSDVGEAFIFAYKMGLGDFNTGGFNTVDEEILWIIFLINTLLILIVLLNLVIAIMGDTFDRVQETQEKSMLRELAQMIRENEFLFSRGRTFKRSKYIIVIEPEKAEGENKGSWDGKLNQLKTFIEDSSEAHISHLNKLQDGIENITAIAIDEKLRPIEDKIGHKLSQCDQKLDKIKSSLDTLFQLQHENNQ